jgi:putative transposase
MSQTRRIGTVCRELLDRTLFWTTADLETKLLNFKHHYNGHRAHADLEDRTPEPGLDEVRLQVSFRAYRWQRHCRGLYQTPIAA